MRTDRKVLLWRTLIVGSLLASALVIGFELPHFWMARAQISSIMDASQIRSANRIINERLKSLSAPGSDRPIDCGSTTMDKPEEMVSACATDAIANRKSFYLLYSGPFGIFQYSYGLAGDAVGNIYQVQYDSKGLLYLGLDKKSQVFDDNRIRVTTCIKPVRVGKTEEGMLACLTPVNEQESALAARQKPIEATVCTITEDPAAFNNKMVRVHGYVSGNFEYSDLGADDCPNSIWFAYGNGEEPPGLVAHVNGGARPGAEDADGRFIRPVPVILITDTSFEQFQKLMKARDEADAQYTGGDPDSYTFHRVAATFTGRIDGVSNDIRAFRLKRKSTDRSDFLGFGQMGSFDAQFVLQSVANDAVLETFPPTPRTQ